VCNRLYCDVRGEVAIHIDTAEQDKNHDSPPVNEFSILASLA
jgi:hypothetical protein